MSEERKIRHCIVIDRDGNPHPTLMGKIKRNEGIRFISPCKPAKIYFFDNEIFEEPLEETTQGEVSVFIKTEAPKRTFQYTVKVQSTFVPLTNFDPQYFVPLDNTEGGGEGGGEVGGG